MKGSSRWGDAAGKGDGEGRENASHLNPAPLAPGFPDHTSPRSRRTASLAGFFDYVWRANARTED
jgi:hypothetical protein